MPKSTIVAAAALVLTGCVGEPPPIGYPPPSAAAPTTPASPPARVAQHLPPPHTAPKPRPEEVKPLGEGLLTALTVGNYMDDQEKDLRAKLRGSGVTVTRSGDNLVLNIRSDSLFAGNSTELSRMGEEIVHAVAGSARKFDSTTLAVDGFTDTTGTAGQNLKVSQLRAESVGKALVAEGVDPHRVAPKGFGADYLKVPTGPNVDEPRNRRVEIDITPRVKT
jgi:outer membrane protein OmpA-like peptidoglycan-associated protein